MSNTTTNPVADVIHAISNVVIAGDDNFNSETAIAAISDSDYGNMERGEKARIRNAIIARKNSALADGKFPLASRYFMVENAFKNARGNAPETDPVDELRNVIRYAAFVVSEMISGNVSPDGIDPVDLSAEFDFEFAYNGDSEMPEFDAEMVSRFVPRRISRAGKQNAIGNMIELAMAEFPIDQFVKVSEIRNKIGELGLANVDSSWDGRISARLFPNGEFTLSDSIVPMHSHNVGNGQTRNGAKRVS